MSEPNNRGGLLPARQGFSALLHCTRENAALPAPG